MFDCIVVSEEKIPIFKNVKYCIENFDEASFIIPYDSNEIFVFDKNAKNENILKIKFGNDTFYFLLKQYKNEIFTNQFKYNSNQVNLTISNKIFISIDGELICEQNVENLKFSHFEILGDHCLIHFNGTRNFLVVLQQKKLLFADYYDEYNEVENEKYFMCKLKDSLNHGRVCHIDKNKAEVYLVYLDDNQLELKDELTPFVFLDCIISKNYLYSNSLLIDDIKLSDLETFKKFFPDFDYYYPLNEKTFALIKKNTLSGICEIIAENKQISNIIFH